MQHATPSGKFMNYTKILFLFPIECNIAKPRGEKGGDRGGRGGRGGGRGGQGGRGGGRMCSGGNSISIGSGTGANKKKTFD